MTFKRCQASQLSTTKKLRGRERFTERRTVTKPTPPTQTIENKGPILRKDT